MENVFEQVGKWCVVVLMIAGTLAVLVGIACIVFLGMRDSGVIEALKALHDRGNRRT